MSNIFNFNPTPSVPLDFKGKPVNQITVELLKAGFIPFKKGADFVLIGGDAAAAQLIIDAYEVPLPNLTPRQFDLLLGYTGLYDAIPAALDHIKTIDNDLYLHCRSQLDKATFFEWVKAIALYTQLKPILIVINPALDYTDEQLKTHWLNVYTM